MWPHRGGAPGLGAEQVAGVMGWPWHDFTMFGFGAMFGFGVALMMVHSKL